MKEPYPSQKYHVLVKLKMARSGQGWQRLKIPFLLLSAKIRSRGSPHQTFGATELGSPIISTSSSLMSITNIAPACQESGLTQGQSIPASTSLPSLVPPFASLSSSFHHQIHPSAFPSSSSSPLPPRKVLLSIWTSMGQNLERLGSKVLKDFWLFVCFFFLLLFL